MKESITPSATLSPVLPHANSPHTRVREPHRILWILMAVSLEVLTIFLSFVAPPESTRDRALGQLVPGGNSASRTYSDNSLQVGRSLGSVQQNASQVSLPGGTVNLCFLGRGKPKCFYKYNQVNGSDQNNSFFFSQKMLSLLHQIASNQRASESVWWGVL